ncbi:hypothetical protein RN001_003540 [Aquatica leii]|uniref:tRNA (carboxymethyluridine(34)-5-O)-methyltransferase n=1 Tax=Aquatica leii TaxID=1421715 RepID=A0AAN7Q6F2_9COLE|nr:hypothetical protein RN001_003540 [Aquatica leii]
MDGNRSKNYEKKLNKKAKRSQHIVEKQTGIRCTDSVTQILAICNSGLVNGLSEDLVFESFIKYGPLEKIKMVPGKSCAFVSYKSLESAALAYNNIHGKLNIAQDNKPLHLSFVESFPEDLINKYDMPPGLLLLENFISEEEENRLLQLASFDADIESTTGTLKHRQVKHYGYEFRYDINNVDKEKPLSQEIPPDCSFLWKRLQETSNLFFEPDQLTINKYKPGQGIPPHIDTHSAFEDPIVSLSMGSSIVMEFRQDNGSTIPVLLKQRSMLIMSGESRYNWTHGITPRKMDIIPTETGLTVEQRGIRVSFTFRKVLKGECSCNYVNKCDSFLRANGREIQSHSAVKLEKSYVHDIYENIADHFSDTRHKPWPNVVGFIDSFEAGSVLLDVGCGNGKYLACNQQILKIGCDSSSSLVNVCRQRSLEAYICNCLHLPFKDQSVDGVISIAVIHHLANTERRLQAIKELRRILKLGGRALIYVWAKDQYKDEQKSTYLKQDRRNRKGKHLTPQTNTDSITITENNISLPVHTNRTQFQHQDVLVPWKLKQEKLQEGDKLFLRFYHVFEKGELEEMCKDLDNVEIVKSYYDEGNWCILLKKI